MLQRLSLSRLATHVRHLSQTKSLSSKWNYVIYSQNLDLGREVFESSAVTNLIGVYPNLSASMINDVVQSLSSNNDIHSKLNHVAVSSAESSNDVFAKLGELTLKKQSKDLNALLQEIRSKCIVSISLDDIMLLVKQQHPKAILKDICTSLKVDFVLETRKIDGFYKAIIYNNKGEKLFSAKNEKEKEAERNVCLQVLNIMYPSQFNSYNVASNNVPLEENVCFLGTNKQRAVCLSKSSNQLYGFHIQGGEQRLVRNEDYIQCNIITPIFISHVEYNTPADKCGICIGDVLLSVEDHSLKNVSHNQAVTSLKYFQSREIVNFIVMQDKMELLKYQAEQRFLEREKERIRQEISSDRLGSWHQAKSIANPKDYFLEKFEHKKRRYQHHKARKSIRLWDYPSKKR